MKKISYRPVYNRKNRLNKQGKALLQIEAYLEKRKVYFSSHIHLTPQQWDKRRERIVAHPNAEALNLMLATFMMELEQKELELWKNGQDITLEKLKETFIKENMHTFLEFAKREIEDSQLKESTRKNRLTTCYLLAKFKQRISFKDLTSKFIFEFESFLYQQGCHTNTVAKHTGGMKYLFRMVLTQNGIVALAEQTEVISLNKDTDAMTGATINELGILFVGKEAVLPELTGKGKVSGTVTWGDGTQAAYAFPMSYSFKQDGEHEVRVQAIGATAVEFTDLSQVEEIDLSGF